MPKKALCPAKETPCLSMKFQADDAMHKHAAGILTKK